MKVGDIYTSMEGVDVEVIWLSDEPGYKICVQFSIAGISYIGHYTTAQFLQNFKRKE